MTVVMDDNWFDDEAENVEDDILKHCDFTDQKADLDEVVDKMMTNPR